MSLIGTAIQVAMTAKENKIQRKFVERMSNTAYQRGMADMRKAGLNPILAYKTGGATTPTGGGGSFKADVDPIGAALQVAQGRAGIALTKQQEATSAQTAKTIGQDRKYKLPGQKYEALKDNVKFGVATDAITSAKTTGIRKALDIMPDFSNPLDRKNPKGSYIDRGTRALNSMRSKRAAAHRRATAKKRGKK